MAVTALLRESHTPNQVVTALFTNKAASLKKGVKALCHATALLRDQYCNSICCKGALPRRADARLLSAHARS